MNIEFKLNNMLLYNLKQSFRRMRENKVFTFLNLAGFAVGFAASIILALFIYKEYSVDRGYANCKNIYRLIDAKGNKARMDYDISKMVKEKFPEIEYATPLNYTSASNPIFLRKADRKESVEIKNVISTTNDFFKIFSLKTISSLTAQPFADNNSLVVTRSVAEKLFGKVEASGILVNVNGMFDLPVSAVVEDLPENSSLQADIFLNSENEQFRFSQYCSNGKCYNPLDQYISVHENTDAIQLTQLMNSAFPANKSETDSIRLQPLSAIYLANNITDNENKAGSKGLLMIFLTIAVLVLLMSVINYVNFSLSKQLSTLKELGIKITTGAGPGHLRSFYLTEVAVFVSISFLIALGITTVTLPYAGMLLGSSLDIRWLFSPTLFLLFTLIVLSVILISSLAPIYIISKFDIQRLFGKKNLFLGRQTGKKVLTIFQVTATIVLLICLISIQKQLNYVKTTNLGFNKEQLLKLNFPQNFNNQEALKLEITNYPFVKNTSLSNGSPGSIRVGMGDKDENGKFFNVQCIYIDSSFVKTFGIHLLEGREFLNSDFETSCYINEAAYKKYGWDNLENRKFNNGREGGYKIVGVVNDFNTESLHKAIGPVCLIYKNQYSSLNIKLTPGNLQNQMSRLKAAWDNVIPDEPFSYTFYDAYFDSMYKKEDRQGKAIALFSIVILVITCLGFLGQIIQSCLTRIKEIGIRKVNGARISEVLIMLNSDFVKWVAIAFVIATPIAYYTMYKWLENFAYKTSLNWWIFALAGLLALGIALLTVSWQSWKAATRNPVEALRYE
jgi:putative ABC transport system permease protein